MLDFVGAEKSSFWQMRFVLGWGPRSKLHNGLEAQPKSYWWRFEEFTLFYALGLDGIDKDYGMAQKSLPTTDTSEQ